MFEGFFEMYGLRAFFSVLFGIPIVVAANTTVALVINWLLRVQKKSAFAVALPSLLAPLMISGIVALSFVFIHYREESLRSAVDYLLGFVGLYPSFSLITTVPQLLTHAILKRKTSNLRPIISVVFGCAIVISYALILWTVGRMIGATPD